MKSSNKIYTYDEVYKLINCDIERIKDYVNHFRLQKIGRNKLSDASVQEIASIQSAIKKISQDICSNEAFPIKQSEIILKKSFSGGEIDSGVSEFVNNRLLANCVWINEQEYARMCVNALRTVMTTVASDFGSSRQRDFGQLWADKTRGYLGEIAFVKFLKEKWGIDSNLGHDEGTIDEYKLLDIHQVQINGHWRSPNIKIGIKATKWNGIWLDIPGAQFNHSDIHVLVKVGTGRDHLFSFFKEISVFKDKILRKGVEVGSLNQDEANYLYESLPSYTNIPAYICGFVKSNEIYTPLSYGGKKGRTNYTITAWKGFYDQIRDLDKVKKQESVNKAEFEGIRNFSHSGYVFNTGNLLWKKNDWDSIIEKL
ncbi:hypothetical protein IQ218_06190 [Synechocystis salina LEGE 06099]|uniref:hypothetical protein n=1 Tax=Synechocystis salina TaxID=945780 RepID=UPI0018831100|nr:hypothetical protein [Synechocystis salina]MBE9203117.1 hypothetical protein [Synechocystis salina LEGE 06099]